MEFISASIVAEPSSLLEPRLQPTLLLLDGKEGLLDCVGRVLALVLCEGGLVLADDGRPGRHALARLRIREVQLLP